MKRLLKSLLIISISMYVGACLYMFLAQRSMLYYPTPKPTHSNDTLMSLKLDGETINVSVFRHTKEDRTQDALLYFGGNAEDVSQNLDTYINAFPSHDIYLPHYRGYGGSSGKPSESALHADAAAVYKEVSRDHKNIVLIGRSLGSGVAIRLAATKPVSRLVLVTPYDSIANVAQDRFKFLPVKLLLKDKFESWRYAPDLTIPTVLVAAQNDLVIPMKHTVSLYEQFAPGVASLITIPDAGHNDLSDDPNYLRILQGVNLTD